QRLPGGVPGDAAEQADVAGEPLAGVESTAAVAVAGSTLVEVIKGPTQRIADAATGAEVAGGDAEAEVEVVPAFAGHQVFAAEQAGAAQIAKTQRELGHVAALFEQTQLEVNALVQIVATTRTGLVIAVANGSVAKAEFEPAQWLHTDVNA